MWIIRFMSRLLILVLSLTTLISTISAIHQDLIASPSSSSSSPSSSSTSLASNSSFTCPEQFGYFEDRTDCSKYFVCVFGEPLHESCTGGLYFSSELQTCDWPRNVHCGSNASSLELGASALKQLDDVGHDKDPFASQIGDQPTAAISVSAGVAGSVSPSSPGDSANSRTSDLQSLRSNLNNNFVISSSRFTGENDHGPVVSSPSSLSRPKSHLLPAEAEGRNKYESFGSADSLDSAAEPPRSSTSYAVGGDSLDNLWNIRNDPIKTIENAPASLDSDHSSKTWDAGIQDSPQDRYFRRVNTPSSTFSAPTLRPSSRQASGEQRNYDMSPKGYLARNPLVIRANHSLERPLAADKPKPYRHPPSSDLMHKKPLLVASIGATSSAIVPEIVRTDGQQGNEGRNEFFLPPYAGFESRRKSKSDWSVKNDAKSGLDNSPSDTDEALGSPWNFDQSGLELSSNTEAKRTTIKPVLRETVTESYDYENSESYSLDVERFNVTSLSKAELKDNPFSKPSKNFLPQNFQIVPSTNNRPSYGLGSILLDITSGSGVPSEHGQPFGLVDYEEDAGDQVPAERRPKTSPTPQSTSRPLTRSKVSSSVNSTGRTRASSNFKPSPVPVPEISPTVIAEAFKPALKCEKSVCRLPNCNCGSSQIPGGLSREEVPQIVMISFEDAINDLNWNIYEEIFDNKRKNPNGCSILGTFYVSHEWTDYGHVQTLYSRGHEIASHGITHSFGENFSKNRWLKEIQGQREILNHYGAVRTEDIRGMRAPFLQIGGNNMFQMLHEANFTYDSSMPVFDNLPPFWPYTLDYAINHECMITPCPSDSFPGVWEVGLVMWEDLKGGRCSMGDACSNPSDENGVFTLLMKNFERHYNTNRAPFGLYYHSAWFNTAHHRKGFMKFIDQVLSYGDVYFTTKWQMLQWMKNPTSLKSLREFYPWECKHLIANRPPACNHPNVCNVRGQHGHRFMKTCQECPSYYPWLGKTSP